MNKERTNKGIVLSEDLEKSTDPTLWNKENFIISDDICDGGGTFFALAEFIKNKNTNANIFLILSHGIFSQGIEKLNSQFNRIYVVNDEYNNFRLSSFKKIA